MKPGEKKRKKQETLLKKRPAPVPDTDKKINSFLNKYGVYVLIGLISLIVLFVFSDFLFLKKVYLFKDIGSDSINIYLPYWVHIAEYLRTEGLPGWSHQVGMGQNIYLYDMGNPFTLLLYLGGKANIPYLIVYMEVLKIILSGLLIFHYLRVLGLSKFAGITGGLIYAFSGYLILGGSGWPNHSTEVVFAAFFLLSSEKYISEQKWIFLPLASFFIGLWHAYFLFPYSILFLLYFTVRYFDRNGFNLKDYAKKIITAGALLFVGVLMSAPFVINFLLMIYNSPRVSGEASAFEIFSSKPVFALADKTEIISFVMRLFSNDMIGNGNHYRGWGNYLEGPILYISLPALLLLPHFFTGLKKDNKKIYLIVAGLVLLVILFPWFRYMFWGFGLDYFRTFSFFISLFIFYLSMQALQKITSGKIKPSLPVIGITLAVLLFMLYFSNPLKNEVQVKNIRNIVTVFLLLHSLILLLFRFNASKSIAKLIFLMALVIELIYFSNVTVSKRDSMRANELVQKTGYNDYTTDAIRYLNETDKDFYRITKYYYSGLAMHGSMNDALVQGYKSTISYSSLNQKYYVQFLQGVGAISATDQNAVKWVQGVSDRPVLQSLVNCKYILRKNQDGPLDTLGYKKIKTFGNVDLYQNKTWFPLAFPFYTYLTSQEYTQLKGGWKDLILLSTFIADSTNISSYSGMGKFDFSDTLKPFDWNIYYDLAKEHRKNSFTITSHTHNILKGSILMQQQGLLFLSIPYDKGWKVYSNGRELPVHVVNYGLTGIPLEKGEHAVELRYIPPFKTAGISICITGIAVFAILFFYWKKQSTSSGKQQNED